MDVKVFEPPKQKGHKLDKLIPKALTKNIRANLVGASGSGKTVWMKNILFNSTWMKDYFLKSKGEIVLMTTTFDTAEEFAYLAHKHKYDPKRFLIFDYFDMETLEQIYRDMNPKEPNLIILDDCAFLPNFRKHSGNNLITEIFTSGRHSNCGIIVASQKYFFLDEASRSLNATHIVIYSTLSKKEFIRFYDENMSNIMDMESFFKMIGTELKEKYSFITFNRKEKKIYDKKFKEIDLSKYKK
jgi:DNA helicase HerA-like ATPase